MPLTGAIQYYWVGGATGTTAASRFDWNIASNWRVRKVNTSPVSENNLTFPRTHPVAGDVVQLGYGSAFTPGATSSHRINSPLLFGGFSGSVNGGCWICDGATGVGFSGASGGTTFTSALSRFIIDRYPFHVLGGGLTGTSIEGDSQETINAQSTVQGMNLSAWQALAASATTRQQSLNIKTKEITVSSYPVVGNAYFYFKPNIIDSLTNIGLTGTTGYIETRFSISNNMPPSGNALDGFNFKLWLVNSKLRNFDAYSNVVSRIFTGVFTNCVIGDMSIPYNGSITIDNTSTIGRITTSPIVDAFDGGTLLSVNLQGTYKYFEAMRALGLPGATLPENKHSIDFNFAGVTFVNTLYKSVILGGTTYTNTSTGLTFSANTISLVAPSNQIWNVPITTRSIIGDLYIKGVQLYSEGIDPSEYIQIQTLKMDEQSILDLTQNNTFNNWRFGLIQNSASGLTLSGGIQFESTNVTIKGDPGTRLVNYGINSNINNRTNKEDLFVRREFIVFND